MRVASIGVVAAASVAAGMVAVWRLAPRDVMATTPTWVYLGILALLLCPVATVAAWVWDRRAAVRDAHRAPAGGNAAQSSTQSGPAQAKAADPAGPLIVSPPQETHESPRRASPGVRRRIVHHAAK
jgi:hypothetical protein